MIEINLVPDVKQELIKAQRIRSMVVTFSALIGLASIAIVGVLVFYVYAFQGARNYLADKAISDESSKFDKKDLTKTLTIQNQLTKISNLNGDKKITSRVFDMLTAIIPASPNDVRISSLTLNTTDKTISMDGQAANSFDALDIFKKTIKNAGVRYIEDKNQVTVDLASDISTKDISYGQDSSGNKVLRFTISFKYADELFSPAQELVDSKVVITINGNVTDSYLGTKSIFTEPAQDLTEEE